MRFKIKCFIYTEHILNRGAGGAQTVQQLARDLRIRGSNPGGGDILGNRSERPWAPLASYTNRTESFLEVKRSGRGADHPHESSVHVKERVELCLYTPSEPSCPVLQECW